VVEMSVCCAFFVRRFTGTPGEYMTIDIITIEGDDQRKICLIPASAHGTNPASAAWLE
jgi:glycine dehydrogenase